MTVLNFDESRHVYTLFGEGGGETRLPSVTKILQMENMYGYFKSPSNTEKMNFGTHIHKLTEMNDSEIIWSDDLEGRERGHISAWEKFKKDSGFEAIHSEIAVYHPLYLYGAKPDRIAILRAIKECSGTIILDIKTGQPHPAAALQLAAYREAYNAMPDTDPKVSGSAAIYLKDDGTYKLIVNNDHDYAFSLFLSCLQIVRWKEKHKIVNR